MCTKKWNERQVFRRPQPGKKLPLYTTHYVSNPVRLLTISCNAAIENLFRWTEKIWKLSTEKGEAWIRCNSFIKHYQIQLTRFPGKYCFSSTWFCKYVPNNGNLKRIYSEVGKIINNGLHKRRFTDSLCNSKCKFCQGNLLQTTKTVTEASNSWSYFDLSIGRQGNCIINEKHLHRSFL